MQEPVDAEMLARRLLGAWRLVSLEAWADDEPAPVRPLGEQPAGMILYTPDGFMSAQLMLPGRPAYPAEDAHRAGPAELVAAATGYTGYAGSYTVLDGATVVHRPSVALVPNWVGAEQVRRARIDGDQLVLTSGRPMLIDGRARTARITWQRAA